MKFTLLIISLILTSELALANKEPNTSNKMVLETEIPKTGKSKSKSTKLKTANKSFEDTIAPEPPTPPKAH